MGQFAQRQIVGPALALQVLAWFLIGLVSSAALVVVIPPLDALLLVALILTTVWFRQREGGFTPRLVPTLAGVIAFSTYTLIWVLLLGT